MALHAAPENQIGLKAGGLNRGGSLMAKITKLDHAKSRERSKDPKTDWDAC